ncbi:MAG: hypothetical protein ACI30B_05815 [Paludibacteraceae bacterium]
MEEQIKKEQEQLWEEGYYGDKTKVKKEDVVDGIVGQQTEATRKAKERDDYAKHLRNIRERNYKDTIPWNSSINVSFNEHMVSTQNSFDGYNGSIGNTKFKLGHSGIIVVDGNGKTKYYDYGRYDNASIGNKSKRGSGVYRKIIIPDIKVGEPAEHYAKRLENIFKENIEIVVVPDSNPRKTEQYIIQDAHNEDRDAYNILFKNCATTARKAIDAGRSIVSRVTRKANPFTIIANTIGGNYLPTSEQQSDNLKMQGYKSYETK